MKISKKDISIIIFGIFLIGGFFIIYLANFINNNQNININPNVLQAEELCQGLCFYAHQNLSIKNLTGGCLSYPITSLTGRYWVYNGIDCSVGKYDSCITHYNSYILLYNNCSIYEVVYNGKKVQQ